MCMPMTDDLQAQGPGIATEMRENGRAKLPRLSFINRPHMDLCKLGFACSPPTSRRCMDGASLGVRDSLYGL